MRWFNNLKIAVKLVIGFVIVATIAGIVGAIGIVNTSKISENDTKLYEVNTLGLEYVGKAGISYQRIRFYMIKMIATDDINEQKSCIKNVNDCLIETEDYLEKYENSDLSDDNLNIFNEVQRNWDNYASIIEGIMKLVEERQFGEASILIFGDGANAGNILQESFDTLFEYNITSAKATADSNLKLANSTTYIMLIVIFAAVLIAILLGLYLSGMISKPVNKMVEAADKLALGDVNVAVETDSKDEIGKLAISFGKMIDNIRAQAQLAERIAAGDMTVTVDVRSDKDLLNKKLAEMVENNNEVLTNIASAAEQVAVGSKQVSDSSILLSQGATEQASSIEELTASLEEISSQTKLNADNANQANNLAENAKNSAIQGNSQMKEMLKSMEEINESSANISKIIKVIDDIAFQTNILALNAAVEAARAGQHGKGFAVVAEEVRNLAARSANAAKETTDMIEGSIKKTENGTKIAKETATALGEIVDGIQKVAELVNDIAVASNEQASGIGQINQGIMQVSEVVQNNSATSEESAAASEELSSQAEMMKEMVSRFKLKQNVKSYSKYDEMNPELLRMLETMSEKKGKQSQLNAVGKTDISKPKIILSDKEFGKY